ncbi:hypothetical protein F511_45727 [Dorcoceras hygrometricum]|uniref:Uncharacterized protein n=1 Tax=Dorcoceras hygrometricum TaxID=472368 RepID=A0A2Z6ZVE5_9LAMI|nr:hypothetical protein F511_45727 [Dorcoceras hygrometricum]
MGNTDPRHKSRKGKYEVKPQYDDSVDHHKAVVFRHNDSAGRGIQAQPHQNSVGPFRHDDSAGRLQRAIQLSKEIRLNMEHCDVLSMQMDSDLVIYRTTLVRTFQVVTICRVHKSEVLVVLISPHYSKRH